MTRRFETGVKMSAASSFYVPFDQRTPAPPWLWPAFIAVCILSTAAPRSLGFWRVAISGPILISIMIMTPNYDFGDVLSNFSTGAFMLGTFIKWVDVLIIQGPPEEKNWRVPENLEDAQLKDRRLASVSPRADGGWWQKLRWASSMWCTDRGVGWNWRVKGTALGVPYGYSRIGGCYYKIVAHTLLPNRKFVLESVHQALISSLVIDVSVSVLGKSPYGNPDKSTWPDLYTMDLAQRTAIVWHVGVAAVHGGQLPYSVFAAVTVATGLCRPEQWPPLYTSWLREAWSVRQLWGVCWHQHLRRSIKIPADFVVQLLRIPRGSLISRYSQLWLGFLVSAIYHHAGAYMIHRNSGSMYFLWFCQAAMITIEDFIIWVGGKAGIPKNTFTKALGTIWLCIWLSSPFAGVTGANLFMTAGNAANDAHPIHSILGHFRYFDGCNSFFEIIADRWAVFCILIEAFDLLAARRFGQVLAAVPGVVIAGSLLWSNVVNEPEYDLTIKTVGVGWFVLHYLYKRVF
ncbi:O-Mevalon transferase yanI [Talaromyces pinophilus]|nr:O-Mevalon transferase yanI [Talaromyces pinophilus]